MQKYLRALRCGPEMARGLLALSGVYRLLEPGPDVLLATAVCGKPNVMTMSWHMMMEFELPLIGCIVNGPNHRFAALHQTRECIIAIPTVELTPKVVRCGNVSGRRVVDTGMVSRYDMFVREVAAAANHPSPGTRRVHGSGPDAQAPLQDEMAHAR
jgi:hypothetical protein